MCGSNRSANLRSGRVLLSRLAWLTLIIWHGVSNQCLSQNRLILDSLKQALTSAEGKSRVDLMNSIGFEYRYSFPDSTIFYCTQAYEMGRQLKLSKELSKPLSFMGLAYNNKGDYQNSMRYHNQSIEVAIEQNDSVQLAFGYNNLGRMFIDEGDLVRAYENFIRAKDIFEILKEESGLAYVYRSMATIFRSQGDLPRALEMSEQAYALRRKLGEPRLLISSLMELGLVNQAAGKNREALRCFLQADSIADLNRDPVTDAELEVGLAEIYLAESQLEEAATRSSNALKAITENTNQRIFLRATSVQGQYYFRKGNNATALSLFSKLMKEAEKSGNVSFQRDAAFYLSEIYSELKDAPKAQDYHNKFKIFSEMLTNNDLNRQIERLQFQLDLEKKDRENEMLKANEARSRILIEQQRLQNVVLLIVAGAIAVLALVVWFSSRRRRLSNHKLALQNTQVLLQREEIARQNQNLSINNQILSDLNEEKNTLMNIVAHDLKSPLNRIYGLANLMEIGTPLPVDQANYLKLIKDSTRAGLDLITDLLVVNELEEVKAEAGIQDVDLLTLLQNHIKSHQLAAEQKAIQISFQPDWAGTIRTDENYFGRIFDNLLSNAIKFSPRSSEVVVSIRKSNKDIVLSVKDHGPGFSETDRQFLFQKFKKLSARPTGGESSNGLGLAIVKTLADRLGGTIALNSAPGKGSEFVVTLPANLVA